jgi:hypothetical protein
LGTYTVRAFTAIPQIDKRQGQGNARKNPVAATVLGGWIEANPTLVGIVILAVVVCAVTYVVSRLRSRGSGGA